MHSVLRDHLEGYLSGVLLPAPRRELDAHLAVCTECRRMLQEMERSAEEVRRLRPPAGFQPSQAPGFYYRVMQRIEAQREMPLWAMLVDPAFGRRLVFACLLLLAVLGGLVAAGDSTEPHPLTEVILAGRPLPGTPPAASPRLGSDLERNRSAVLAALAADTE